MAYTCLLQVFCPQRSDSYTFAHGCEPEDVYRVSQEPFNNSTDPRKTLVRSDYWHNKGLELHDYIIRDEVSAVEAMLRSGCDANQAIAFRYRTQTLQDLLAQQEMKVLPLHISCIYRRPRMVKLLLKYGADPNRRDFLGRLPLQLALVYWPRHYEITDESELTDNEQKYQAYLQEQQERARVIMRTLIEGGAQVGVVTDTAESLLHVAARYGLLEGVLMLREYGAPLHVQTQEGMTVLMQAVQQGHFYMIETLVMLGADMHAKDVHGQTVIHHLCTKNHSKEAADMLAWLIDHGASLTEPDLYLSTPLHIAASSYNEPAVEVLLEAGADADARDIANHLPLQLMLANLDCRHGINLLLNNTLSRFYLNPYFLMTLRDKPKYQPLYELLKQFTQNPPSLKRIARHTFRRFVGPQNLTPTSLDGICPPGLRQVILNDLPIWS